MGLGCLNKLITVGGKEGSKGYLYQSIIAVLDALANQDWKEVKMEPETEFDKVDFQLLNETDEIHVYQVKSSINNFTIKDICSWFNEMYKDVDYAESYNLTLIGNWSRKTRKFFDGLSKQSISELDNFGDIHKIKDIAKVVLRTSDLEVLSHAVYHRLNIFLSSLGYKINLDRLEALGDKIVLEFFKLGTEGEFISRTEFIKKITTSLEDEISRNNKFLAVIDQLTQKLSEVSKDIDNSNIEQDKRYREVLNEIKAQSPHDYQSGIEIIKKLIGNLKPISALASLDYIEKKYSKSDQDTNKTVITTHLRGVCYGLKLDMNKSLECFIRAHELDNFKDTGVGAACCLAYAILGVSEKSEALFNELIKLDNLNENLWHAKLIYASDEKLEPVLNIIPVSLRLNDYFSIIIKKRISEMSDVHERSLLMKKFVKESTFVLDINTIIDASNLSMIVYELDEQIRNLYLDGSISDCMRLLELNESTVQCHKNLEHFFQEMKETEISDFYPGFEFFLHFFDYIKKRNDSSIYDIKKLLKLLNKDARYYFLNLLVKLLTKVGELDSILNILQNENKKSFELDLAETSILLKLERYDDYFDKSKAILKKMVHIDFYNFEPIFVMIMQFKTFDFIAKVDINVYITNWTYEDDNLRSLLNIQSRVFNNDVDEELLPRLNKIQVEFADNHPSVVLWIAWLYCVLGDPKSAISIYRKLLDKNNPSIHRNTYAKALFHDEPEGEEILNILEQIREEPTYLEDFARLELTVLAKTMDRNRAKIVCEYILLNDNKNEQIYLNYLALLSEMKDIQQLQVEASKIDRDFFSNEKMTSDVAKILIENRLFKGWEILYEYAKHEGNKEARSTYIGNAMFKYGIFMKEASNKVKLGDFVEYSYAGQTSIVEITQNNVISESFIGKKIGDKFYHEQKLSDGIVKILGIKNKYQHLFDQIYSEVRTNPLSGLGMETEKLVMGDPKRIKILFKDLVFVPPNNLELCIASYYKYEISFSQLINWGYKGDYIKGYLDLIENRQGLLVPTLKSYRTFSIENGDALVLDITSVMALQDLSDKFEVNFEYKFLIAKSAYDILISNSKDNLDRAKFNRWILANCEVKEASSKFKNYFLKDYSSENTVTDYIIETTSVR